MKLNFRNITLPAGATRAVNKLAKHSPEIFIFVGIGCGVVSAVMACRATTKLSTVTEPAKEKLAEIHERNEAEENAQIGKELAVTYAKAGLGVCKLYGPSIALGAFSIGCILTSNNILRKRNIALGAAYAALDKGFKDYRGRVIERFGDQVDKELRHNLIPETIEEKEVDPETGKEKKVKKNIFMMNPDDVSPYAKIFDKYYKDADGNDVLNPYWESNVDYSLMFLKAQERYANDLLRSKKILFLNDVYEMLGFKKTKAGQIVGWVYDPEHPNGDNYISFGILDALEVRKATGGHDPAILLDFNVDGDVWQLMK